MKNAATSRRQQAAKRQFQGTNGRAVVSQLAARQSHSAASPVDTTPEVDQWCAPAACDVRERDAVAAAPAERS
jgi:hypothetical protein